MITLKTLKWNNAFSYSDNNEIDLSSEPLIQLVGKNGAGKTSISLILQEVLFGKNIANIKKQDISNRFTNNKGYTISLEFEKDGIEYKIDLDRTTSLKLKFYENGKDISSHTSVNTYKTIGEILGIDDFKVFVQLVYQSSTNSLEFLTATDTNRKRFLINLLQLEGYIELHEKFKQEVKSISNSISSVKGSLSVIDGWLKKHENENLELKELKEEPPTTDELNKKLARLEENLENIKEINKKITTNNHYIDRIGQIDFVKMQSSAEDVSNELAEVKSKISELQGELNHPLNMINKLKGLGYECPTCYQEISTEYKETLVTNYSKEKDNIQNALEDKKETLNKLISLNISYKEKVREIQEFEQLNNLIDNELSKETIDRVELEGQIAALRKEISKLEIQAKEVSKYNLEVSSHNSRVKVIEEQKASFLNNSIEKETELLDLQDTLYLLDLLKNAFGTNGLVSYKIESSVKELEKRINEYLSEFGFFRIEFKLSGDKLNIEVSDDMGHQTTIDSLSAGEKARVNIATVLAIRKMMSSLTNTQINLLFLDEIVGVIDEEGREKLMEILLKENLNTFMVSHGWEHPLIPKVEVIKENNISRIE